MFKLDKEGEIMEYNKQTRPRLKIKDIRFGSVITTISDNLTGKNLLLTSVTKPGYSQSYLCIDLLTGYGYYIWDSEEVEVIEMGGTRS